MDYNKQVGINQESILHLMDSSISGQSGIRSTLAPSIIKIADENKNKFSDIGIFEIARVVDGLTENNLANEKKKLAIVLASENKTEKELYFKLKQVVEYISTHIVKTKVEFSEKTENSLFHPINSCAISAGNNIVGEMGIMHPAISENIDKRKKFAVLELDVNLLLESEKTIFKLEQTSKFQSVSVDYNFVADKNMPYATLEKALSEFRAAYILEHSLKDIYINDEVLKDKISYTINFVITPKDRTLEASDIEKFSARLIQTMQKLGINLRQ